MGIRENPREPRGYVLPDRLAFRIGQSPQAVDRGHDHPIQSTRMNVNRERSALNFREIEEVGNEQQHLIDGTLDFTGKVSELASVHWLVLFKHVRHKSYRSRRIL